MMLQRLGGKISWRFRTVTKQPKQPRLPLICASSLVLAIQVAASTLDKDDQDLPTMPWCKCVVADGTPKYMAQINNISTIWLPYLSILYLFHDVRVFPRRWVKHLQKENWHQRRMTDAHSIIEQAAPSSQCLHPGCMMCCGFGRKCYHTIQHTIKQ